MRQIRLPYAIVTAALISVASASGATPEPMLRMPAVDHGVVMKHGDGPDQCDISGARDVWVWADKDTLYMHYDGAGPTGWLTCLATSTDGLHWQKKGAVLSLGSPTSEDSASASYGVTCFDGATWHMFYLGTRNVGNPGKIPAVPYVTMVATASSPSGPWTKRPEVIPFRCKPGTYYATTSSPGHVVKRGDEYLMFFSASAGDPIRRTIGIARTHDLNGAWTMDPAPIVPLDEQIENTSLYFEPSNKTWFLFTNHIGKGESASGIWVYWTKDLDHWNAADKAVVLDNQNCTWSPACVGLPSVIRRGDRLMIYYDGPGGRIVSHMNRDVAVASLDLPLKVPVK